ncbi:MAG: tetratricopeptide repeat protein [Actinomycetota bacterium]|nr:tetratricopeptide repeat protein [Actinomycetota bacterium]
MPRSRRAVAVVAAIAALAAGVTVAGALVQGADTGGEVHGQTATGEAAGREPPALELAIVDRDDREARALRTAERLYDEGERRAARRRFEALSAENPNSVEAAVGAAVAGWPKRTVARLETIVDRHPESAVARLNLGLALVAERDLDSARRQWREAERRDPDTAAAQRADDLLHTDSPPGRPRLVLATFPRELARVSAGKRIAAARRRARHGGAGDWLFFGAVLESAGRRISAQRAYDRAVALDPRSLEARVGGALARFDKDDPSATFSRLGPLAGRHPRSALVRFHLGLALLWLPNLREARRQLALARDGDPDGFYGRQAARILTRLPDAE